MKTLSIGDIHGRYVLDNIDTNKYDKIIFMGDYVDSFKISDLYMLNTLDKIIKFARNNKNVVLLLGNHDLQYMMTHTKHNNIHLCSGYREKMHLDFYKMFNDNIDLFHPIYQIENTIWTHAGIVSDWYNRRFLNDYNGFFNEGEDYVETFSISELINRAFNERLSTLFDVGEARGGRHICGGPFWADYREHAISPLRGYIQIIGHTPRRKIEHFVIGGEGKTEHVFIDVLTDDEPYNFYEYTI
jgi:hypothetical protein